MVGQRGGWRRGVAVAAAGLAGWLARGVFLASLAAGIYGAYLAWFVSLGQEGPGHDRLAGTIVMGIALGVSLVACAAVCALPPKRPGGTGWFVSTYAVFAALFITVVLPLSGALRSIGTWERTNTQVVSVANGCFTTDDGDGSETDHCDLVWQVHRHTYEQTRVTHSTYADGTKVLLWVNPVTGGADDHSIGEVVFEFIGLFCGLVITATVVAFRAEETNNPRALLTGLAWWRALRPARLPEPRPKPKPTARAEPSDAIPVIEDRRPDA